MYNPGENWVLMSRPLILNIETESGQRKTLFAVNEDPSAIISLLRCCDLLVTITSPSMAKVTYTDVALCVSIETEHGLPGLPGLPAAPAAASASKSVSAPAATRPLAMEDGCVWARTVKRGTHPRTHTY